MVNIDCETECSYFKNCLRVYLDYGNIFPEECPNDKEEDRDG